MEVKVNILCLTRTFVQVICLVRCLLDGMYRWLGCLSGLLVKVLALFVSLIPFQEGYIVVSFIKHLEVAERNTVEGFFALKIHDRRHALFTGGTNKDIYIK